MGFAVDALVLDGDVCEVDVMLACGLSGQKGIQKIALIGDGSLTERF